jgi:predicted transcriptional regulator
MSQQPSHRGARKVEDALAAIADPLSRGRAPVPVPLDAPPAGSAPPSASQAHPRAPRPRPAKRPAPATRAEVFDRLGGPRVLENYPISRRVYLDSEYTRMLDELAALYAQPHSEIVRCAIALLYIEAGRPRGAARDAGLLNGQGEGREGGPREALRDTAPPAGTAGAPQRSDQASVPPAGPQDK